MKITFRQGISRYQQSAQGLPTFLQKENLSGNYIDLNVATDPTVITFSHGATNYTIEEIKYVTKAWGPFQPLGQTQYLYWDINLTSGQLTRAFTLYAPVYGPTAPSSPHVDFHWFDTTTNMMKVWNGTVWVTKVRVFAGSYDHNAIIVPKPLGSQVGITNITDVSGFILFDNNLKPMRQSNQQFMTTESTFNALAENNNSFSALTFETQVKHVSATEFIPKFHCVSFVDEDRIAAASSNNVDRLVAGLTREDTYPTEVTRIYSEGIVFNDEWNFPANKVGKALFCDQFGAVTLTPPTSGVVQQIGMVYSRTSIRVEIKAPIYY